MYKNKVTFVHDTNRHEKVTMEWESDAMLRPLDLSIVAHALLSTFDASRYKMSEAISSSDKGT